MGYVTLFSYILSGHLYILMQLYDVFKTFD